MNGDTSLKEGSGHRFDHRFGERNGVNVRPLAIGRTEVVGNLQRLRSRKARGGVDILTNSELFRSLGGVSDIRSPVGLRENNSAHRKLQICHRTFWMAVM